MPHPLVDKVEIKVQTSTEKTGEVVKNTLEELQKSLYDLSGQFKAQVDKLEKSWEEFDDCKAFNYCKK